MWAFVIANSDGSRNVAHLCICLSNFRSFIYYHLESLCENLVNKEDGSEEQVDCRQHHLL